MNKKRLLIFLMIVLVIFDLAYFTSTKTQQESEQAKVIRVIDGDTLKTTNDTVRLLCINTPEKNQSFYQEAKNQLQELEGKQIAMLRDEKNTDKDRYGRKLRYIFYENRFINKEIVEAGLANIYMCKGLKYEADITVAQQSARKNQLGIWKPSTGLCKDCIHLVELNPKDEFIIINNSCEFECYYFIRDESNNEFKGIIKPDEIKKITSTNIWNDDGDSAFIYDDNGLVEYYSY
jgi:endonuclease YncB( thermonuclease family)